MKITEPSYPAILVEKLRAEDPDAKPFAFDTPFRHSSAGSCTRQLAFRAAGKEESNTFDLPSTFVAWLGTMMHEKWQEACAELLNCEAEVKVKDKYDLASGHLDLLTTGELNESVCIEAKLVHGTKYAKAVGFYKRGWHSKRNKANGPTIGHVIQLALNTQASDADTGVLFYISSEAVSRQAWMAINRRGEEMSESERFMTQWVFSRAELDEIANAELSRMSLIQETVAKGNLPQPYMVDGTYDKPEMIALDPHGDEPPWACVYCPFFDLCKNYDASTHTPIELSESVF